MDRQNSLEEKCYHEASNNNPNQFGRFSQLVCPGIFLLPINFHFNEITTPSPGFTWWPIFLSHFSWNWSVHWSISDTTFFNWLSISWVEHSTPAVQCYITCCDTRPELRKNFRIEIQCALITLRRSSLLFTFCSFHTGANAELTTDVYFICPIFIIGLSNLRKWIISIRSLYRPFIS